MMHSYIFSFLISVSCVYGRIGVLDQNLEHYTNVWKIRVPGGREVAEKIAESEGFVIEREIPELRDVFILKHPRHPSSPKHANTPLTEKLDAYNEVVWVEQSGAAKRELRRTAGIDRLSCPRSNSMDASPNSDVKFIDPYYPAQWTLHDCRKSSEDGPQYDINVARVWRDYGYYGRGIVVVVVDDGLETDHIDLRANYDETFGLDLIDKDYEPDPVHNELRTYSHGTRCGGVIAMQANNTSCGVGIAPLATLGAVRLLGPKKASDEDDGAALLFRCVNVDIVTNSWGPNDDGATMAHLGKVTEAALKTGIIEGRHGRGTIYVFAAGNGKSRKDICSCDPFVSSVYTISVASADMEGKVTNYSERCASVFVTAYSGDGSSMYNVATTDVGKNRCTLSHTGTSASAPQVAAAIALALEANPNLTHRDVQHLFPYTCEVAPLQDNPNTWVRGVTGLYYSLDFGFGMLDVYGLVMMAKTFKSVPPLSICVNHAVLKSVPLSRTKAYKAEVVTTGCKGLPSEINYIEHVQLFTTIYYTKRGDVQITLKSPSGTGVRLLEPRPNDNNRMGIRFWSFETLHAWGEPCAGTWEINIFDQTGLFSNEGSVEQLTLIFHGTKLMPDHYKQRRSYYEFRLPNSNEK